MTPEELTAARKMLKLKGTEMARLMGAAYRTLQAWERGERKIPPLAERMIAFMLYVPRHHWPPLPEELAKLKQDVS